MPVAIPIIVAAAAEAGVFGALTATEMAIIAAAAAAASAAITAQQAKSAQRRAASANQRDLTVTIQSSAEPRRTIYGRARVGGPIIYATNDQANTRYMHRLIAIAEHQIDAWENFWFNDDLLPMLYLPWTTDQAQAVQFGRYVYATSPTAAIEVKMGSPTQTAMDSVIAANPDQWTEDHRLQGCAYVRAQTNYEASIYTEGLPSVSTVIRGKRIFDPRDSATRWTQNPALVIRDYLINAMEVDPTSIDDASFIAAANVCDEWVIVDTATTSDPAGWIAYLDAAVAHYALWEHVSGTVYRQHRYTFNGVVQSDVNPGNILEQMVTTCAGYLSYTGGVYRLVAGSYTAPTLTLTEKDFRGPVSVRPKPSRRDRFNEARGTFVGPLTEFAVTDFPPVKSVEFLAEDNGFPSPMDADFPFTNESVMAQRLARILLLKSRQGTVTLSCTLTALALRPGDTVAVTLPALGFDASPFRVEGWKFNDDFGIDLSLREDAAALYDWSPDLPVKDPSPNINLPSPWDVPAITGLTASSGIAQSIVQNDGTIIQRTRLVWDAVADNQFARWVQIQSHVIGEATWTDYPNGVDADGFAYLLNMRTGIAQQIRARRVNTVGAIGDWATIAYTPTQANEVENLIQNSNWEDDLGFTVGAYYPDTRSLRAWGPGYSHSPGSNFGRNYDGGKSWSVGRGGAWMVNTAPGSGYYQYVYQWIPIVPGYEYELQARCSLHRVYAYVAINWYTPDKVTTTGSIADGVDSGDTVIGTPGQLQTYPKFWCKGLAPAGTGWALVHCLMQNTAATEASGTSSYTFWHQSMLNIAPPGVTRETATPWVRSANDTVDGQRVVTITKSFVNFGASNYPTSFIGVDEIILGVPTFGMQIDAVFEANVYEFASFGSSAPHLEFRIAVTYADGGFEYIGTPSPPVWCWPVTEVVKPEGWLDGLIPLSLTYSLNMPPSTRSIRIRLEARGFGVPVNFRMAPFRWNVYLVRKTS